MHSFETIDLGSYRGDDYFLCGFVEPEPADGEDYIPDEDADEYGITLARAASHPLDDKVQIVRMDTCHEKPHMDLVYLPPDAEQDKKVWLDEGYEYGRMRQYLRANWQDFVDTDIKYNE